MTTNISQKAYKAAALIAFLVTAAAHSQYAPEVEQFRETYPNTGLVRTQQTTDLQISLKKGNIEISQRMLEEDLFLDEGAIHNSKRSLHYSSFNEIKDIEAASFAFKDGKYQEKEVKDFTEKDELEDSFYDDSRSINFLFPDLKKGSRTKLEYTEVIKNPRFLRPFYFSDYFPILRNKFSITVDEDINLRFLEFNTEGLDLKFSEEIKRGRKIYTWETGAVDQFYRESGGPSYSEIMPHIIPVISSYKVNGKEVRVLEDVSDLYGWYQSMVGDLNAASPAPELVKLVEELTAGKESELEKVRAIYYWTQQNIKYIAFEYALGGFIPREANLVFKNKYGDCKDNSSILQEMLEIAGIKGQLTWIGTRSIPYTYEEMPTPMVDNHMILSYVSNGATYYLDATGRFLPLELPSAFIQGKEALIEAPDGSYKIQKVPVVPAKNNAFVEVTQLEIAPDRITGKSTASLSGYIKSDLFNELESIQGETKLREYYNSLLGKGNNKFLVQDFKEENKYKYDGDFSLTYSFDVRDYVQRIGKEIYLNLNMNRHLSNYRTLKDRKNEILYEYQQFVSYTTELQIPEGYEVEYLPENEEFSNELVDANISYSIEGDRIIYKHEVELKFISLDLEQQKAVNQLIEKAEKAYKEVVILKNLKTS